MNNENVSSGQESSATKTDSASDAFSAEGSSSATSAGQEGAGGIGSIEPASGYGMAKVDHDSVQGDLGKVENARERNTGSGGEFK